MTVRKLEMFFTSSEGYGWTEKHYWQGPTATSIIKPLLDTLVQQRAAMMTDDTSIDRIRIAGDFSRDPLIYDYFGNPIGIGAYAERVNNSANGVIVRSEAANVGYNRNFFRGIPDSLITGNVFTPDSSWLSAFNTLRSNIVGSGNFVVQANVDNPQAPVDVASATQSPPKGIHLVLATGGTLPFPGRVRIRGASVIGYNGVKILTRGPTGADPLGYLCGGALPQGNNPTADHVTATPLIPLSGAVTEFFYERFAQRKPGRPFGFVRGRGRTTLSLRP